ncbi:MAG TPA: ankyrin repeat domain-containing protein [Chitinispirillaceae bacterium]|nr:ankyrin repeat domain-containing protein [Chitinispirillaceae bacterium]
MNLIRASSKGDLATVKASLESGAKVNQTDTNGRTALIEASWGGYLEVAKYLIEHKADVNVADVSGYTALMRAAEEGNLEVVKLLIKSQADVNCRGKVRGSTALMLAAEQGHIKIIDQLIDGGAKINAVDLFEETALARAFKCNQKEVVDHLENKGGRGKPERNTFTYNDKESKPIVKATLPEWNAGTFDSHLDEDIPMGGGGGDEGFDDE